MQYNHSRYEIYGRKYGLVKLKIYADKKEELITFHRIINSTFTNIDDLKFIHWVFIAHIIIIK